MSNKEYDYLFKLLLIGDSGVGKSSFIIRFVDNTWDEKFIKTIVDFVRKFNIIIFQKIATLDIKGKIAKLQIWDTAGHERYRSLIPTYCKGAHGILVVYDITKRESFRNLNYWLSQIEQYANNNILKLLIGNKCDLESKREVSFQEGKEFAEKNGMKFIETSAKTNQKVSEAFESFVDDIIRSMEKKLNKSNEENNNNKEEIEKDYKELNKKIEEYENVIKNQEMLLNQNKNLIEELENKNFELRHKYDVLSKENSSLRYPNDKNNQLKFQIKELKSVINDLKKKKWKLKKMIHILLIFLIKKILIIYFSSL